MKYIFLLLTCLYSLLSFSQTSDWERSHQRVENEIKEKKNKLETNRKIILEIRADTIKSGDDKRNETSALEAQNNELTREIETNEHLLKTYETLIKNDAEAKKASEEKKERERLEEEQKRKDEEKRQKLEEERKEAIKRQVREKIEKIHNSDNSQ